MKQEKEARKKPPRDDSRNYGVKMPKGIGYTKKKGTSNTDAKFVGEVLKNYETC